MEEVKGLVSVVIPVYNDLLVGEAVESVLRQSYRKVEVIVVDDGSGPEVATALQAVVGDGRVRYVRQESNTNADVCRNVGIALARGEYVAFLDSDDLYMPTHVGECVRRLQREGADGLYGGIVLERRGGNRIYRASLPREGETMLGYLLQRGYGACTPTLFMTRRSAEAVGWDESLNRHQDYDFVVRYARRFRWCAKELPSAVCRPTPSAKQLDFASCIRFIQDNRADICPQVYLNYCRGMLAVAQRRKAPKEVTVWYAGEVAAVERMLAAGSLKA